MQNPNIGAAFDQTGRIARCQCQINHCLVVPMLRVKGKIRAARQLFIGAGRAKMFTIEYRFASGNFKSRQHINL